MKSAAEVRQRGDQIRRRRRAVVAAGAVAVAAAVAGPIIVLSSGFGDRAIDPAPAPSETPNTTAPSQSGSAGSSDLSRANLPVAKDLVGPLDASWAETQTYDGEGKDAYNPCFTKTLDDAGADATFRRDFGVGRSLGSDENALGTMSAVVAEFSSPDAAKQVRDDLADASADCSTVDASTSGSLPVEGGVISAGDINVVSYLPDDPDMNARWEVATAVVAAEDRVLVLTRQRGVQDYVSPTDLQSSAVNAARRMIGAEVAADTSTDPSAPGSSAPTGVLSTANLVGAGDLAPLDRFGDGADWQAYTPPSDVPTLACQKDWVSSLNPTEKLISDFHATSEGVDVGQVHVAVLDFADANDAGAAYNEVMEWQEVCPADKLDVQPEVTDLPTDVGTDLKLGLDRAARSQATYGARSEGDGMWFETELVAQYDGRLVLVGYSELAGPCPPSTGDKDDPCYQADQPDSWPGRILDIEKAAVKAGVRDLR